MKLLDIERAAQSCGLTVLGIVAPEKRIVLLGPDNDFWAHFSTSAEYKDAQKNPIDRWSKHVITDLAHELSAKAHFPFGEPPYAPFFTWALHCDTLWQSPLGMLVHKRHGLLVSFRGALEFKHPLRDVEHSTNEHPCDACSTQSCLTACPVNAFSDGQYDVNACKRYINPSAPDNCFNTGCAARLACPLSDHLKRPAAQTQFYMQAFSHKAPP